MWHLGWHRQVVPKCLFPYCMTLWLGNSHASKSWNFPSNRSLKVQSPEGQLSLRKATSRGQIWWEINADLADPERFVFKNTNFKEHVKNREMNDLHICHSSKQCSDAWGAEMVKSRRTECEDQLWHWSWLNVSSKCSHVDFILCKWLLKKNSVAKKLVIVTMTKGWRITEQPLIHERYRFIRLSGSEVEGNGTASQHN